MTETLLTLDDLAVHFQVGSVLKGGVRTLKAVDGVNLAVKPGECLGLVGESGCGKSTLALSIMGLVAPTRGEVRLNGKPPSAQDRMQTARTVQMVFQDPYASLNPRQTVRRTLADPLRLHGVTDKAEVEHRVMDMLAKVGLRHDQADRYPHEFSGGQRQRIGIARALAVEPKLIVCDEPVSALDVSIQAQVINLLEDLQEEFGLTYLFIAHDLSVVEHISTRVAVMYLGRVVEIAPSRDLYDTPLHPYTEALLSAVPIPDPTVKRKRIMLQGDVPNPIRPPSGCHFHTRCPIAKPDCAQRVPELREARPGHWVSCHYRG